MAINITFLQRDHRSCSTRTMIDHLVMEATEDVEEEMKLQAEVWKHIYGFADSLVLKCAIELGVFDKIHKHKGASTTLSSLAPLASTPHNSLHRLLRHLVSMGLLEMTQDKHGLYGFALTELGELLVMNEERSLAKWALAIIDQRSMSCWYELSRCCSGEGGGKTPFERLYGASVWEVAGRDEELNRLIDEAMASDTRLVMPAFIQACGGMLEGVDSMVDVGGGTGAAMQAVAEAFPRIDCAAFDLPHVVETAGQCDGVRLIAGDMFDTIPACGAVLLKFILHNFDDGDCIKILNKCKEAVPEERGKVIIIEIVMDINDDDNVKERAKPSLDIDMMVTSGGRERTGKEWNSLLHRAGLTRQEIISLPVIQSVIVAYP